MAAKAFETPVSIVTDGGQVREIATPFEAYTFLAGRKTKKLDLSDALLRKKCSAASVGIIKAKTARDAFVRYAEKHSILAPMSAAVTVPDAGEMTALPA